MSRTVPVDISGDRFRVCVLHVTCTSDPAQQQTVLNINILEIFSITLFCLVAYLYVFMFMHGASEQIADTHVRFWLRTGIGMSIGTERRGGGDSPVQPFAILCNPLQP